MGLVDSIKNFFGNNTETMNTGSSDILRGAPVQGYDDFYDDFSFPYSPLQRTKRYPKIINAYALQERARADVRGFINHKVILNDLIARVSALEEFSTKFEVRTISTQYRNYSANDSSVLKREFTIESNEEIIGVRSLYVSYGNSQKVVSSNFNINNFGFTVTEDPTDNIKNVELRVAITNHSGQSWNGVCAVVEYIVHAK